MKYGMLSQEFEGIAAKRLRAVEAQPLASNQHEINGVQALRSLLGSAKLERHPTTFIRLAGENEGISEESWLTWYDSREKHPTRTEWRLYFPNNSVMELARPGDLLVVAKRRGGGLLMLVVPAEGTLENQIAWLFGLDGALGESFRFETVEGGRDRALDFAARYILDELGIEFEEPEAERLDALLERFGTVFPTTRVFSQFARETLPDVSPADDPDGTLVAWLTHEEALFRRLERRIIADRLMAGFGGRADLDVDGFLHFSLSVQNRR